jgi:hypothetical protein
MAASSRENPRASHAGGMVSRWRACGMITYPFCSGHLLVMSLDRVPAGKDIPNDCNVIIEIPMRADPIK